MTLTITKTEWPHGFCPNKECNARVQVFFGRPVCYTHRVKHDGNKPICGGSGEYARAVEK